MAYRFKRKESVIDAVRRVGREEVEAALQDASCQDPERIPEAVHQLRKRCKKVRGLLRIVRPGMEAIYAEENAWFRDTAALVSTARDAKTMLDTYDAVMDHFQASIDRSTFGPIRRKLTLHRKQLLEEVADVPGLLEQARERLQTARDRIDDWKLECKGRAALFAGIEKTYARGQDALQLAGTDGTPEAFHEWRKRVKYHWYHCRLLQGIWPEALGLRRRIAHGLSDQLGNDHDLAVLEQHISTHPDDFGQGQEIEVFRGLLAQRHRQYCKSMFPIGRRLYAEKPNRFCDRWNTYLRLWRSGK